MYIPLRSDDALLDIKKSNHILPRTLLVFLLATSQAGAHPSQHPPQKKDSQLAEYTNPSSLLLPLPSPASSESAFAIDLRRLDWREREQKEVFNGLAASPRPGQMFWIIFWYSWACFDLWAVVFRGKNWFFGVLVRVLGQFGEVCWLCKWFLLVLEIFLARLRA